MNKDKTDKKTAAGCLLIAAFFFFFLAIYQCSEERQEKQTKQEIRYSAPAPYGSDKPTHTKRVATGTYAPTTETNTNGDPYDNPDFDDLIPGEEYDEDFIDHSSGDHELYDEP